MAAALALFIASGAAGKLYHRVFTGEDKSPPQLLGEKFYDPQRKLTYYPPAGWHAKPSEELQKRFSSDARRLIAHFEGPNPGDQADLLVMKSPERLRLIRDAVMAQKGKLETKEIADNFGHVNGVPAWIHEYLSKEGPFVSHSIYVMLDRGDRKVMLCCTGSPRSMESQRNSILESLKSIKLE